VREVSCRAIRRRLAPGTARAGSAAAAPCSGAAGRGDGPGWRSGVAGVAGRGGVGRAESRRVAAACWRKHPGLFASTAECD